MDTYGHLFKGQEADAVAHLQQMLTTRDPTEPEPMRATGTDDTAARSAQQQAQHSARETVHARASRCDEKEEEVESQETPKVLRIAKLRGELQDDAKEGESRPGRTRTRDKGIMSPLL